ncbi:MAG: Acylphosphatase [Anaerolineae bacterium]|nr:Acylphosphatase [Anaerolineae bacterium]
MTDVQARILIEGRLQGINFRYLTQDKARGLGLVGFVRTLADGRVEIEAQGNKEQVDELLEWCQQEPHSSLIKSILFRYDEVTKGYADFSVR